ncbi:hypothetical protein [Kurthia senegalensis]|nr:hypothetical protein [Kurthia senegalensis]
MDYSAMLDNMYLTKELQALAICEAVQPLYINEFEEVAEWTSDVMMMQQDKEYVPSASFQKLLTFVQIIMLDNRAFRKIDLREKLADETQRNLLDQVMRPILQKAKKAEKPKQPVVKEKNKRNQKRK